MFETRETKMYRGLQTFTSEDISLENGILFVMSEGRTVLSLLVGVDEFESSLQLSCQ